MIPFEDLLVSILLYFTDAQTINAFLRKSPDMPDRESIQYGIVLALHELFTNIIRHAYADRSDGLIFCDMLLEKGSFTAIVADNGLNFDAATVAEPDLDTGQAGGYGLFLIKQLLDEVAYEPLAAGNRWRLVKRW